MPAPSLALEDRPRRVAELSRLIEKSGIPSLRAVARMVAARMQSNPDTMWTNLRRWLAEVPREGAIDAAPDHIIELMREIAAETPTRRAAHEALDKLLEAPGSKSALRDFRAALIASGVQLNS